MIWLACASAVVRDVVGHALRREQRVAQLPLVLAVLLQQRFHLGHLLPELVDLPQRVLVIVGDLGHQREHFGAVEAAEGGAEAQLSQDRGD